MRQEPAEVELIRESLPKRVADVRNVAEETDGNVQKMDAIVVNKQVSLPMSRLM
jgi:hypothetical protein